MSIADVSRSPPGVFSGCQLISTSKAHLVYLRCSRRGHVFQIGFGIFLQKGGDLVCVDRFRKSSRVFVVCENECTDGVALLMSKKDRHIPTPLQASVELHMC